LWLLPTGSWQLAVVYGLLAVNNYLTCTPLCTTRAPTPVGKDNSVSCCQILDLGTIYNWETIGFYFLSIFGSSLYKKLANNIIKYYKNLMMNLRKEINKR
jgi:hypothetical protein